jgi:deazaflavin-dependent oxidoreductase (nitroreductase family)
VQNLRSEPAVTIYIRRKPRAVRARIAEGEERVALWRQLTDSVPSYREYEQRTERQIPVVIFDPA